MALRWMRDQMKYLKWVLGLVIFLFVAWLFFDYAGVNSMQQDTRRSAATVGGEEISFAEFQREYNNQEARLRQAFGDNFNRDLARQFNLPKQAIDQLINRRILLLEARQLGLRATDGEIQEAILQEPVFNDEDGNFVGFDDYRNILRRARLNEADFERSVSEGVLLSKLRTVLAETIYVSDPEIEQAFRDTAERAKVRFVQLPSSALGDRVDSASLTVTQEELASYFADHQDTYELPERRVVDYLLIDLVQLRRELEIPDPEMLAYYDDNSSDFESQEKVKARHILIKANSEAEVADAEAKVADIRRRIEAGEDFAQLAGDLSEDEVSAAKGGDLGFFARELMVKPFADAAFDAAIGELVGPVKSEYGFHLIEVTERQEGGVQPFEQVRGQIRSRLVSSRGNELAETTAKEVEARIASENLGTAEGLRQLAEEGQGLSFETSQPFGDSDIVAGIGRSADFNAAAFELAADGISEPIQIPRGWVILRLREVQAPRVQELSEVETEVRRAAELQKKTAAAQQLLAASKDAIDAGEQNFDEVAEELGLEIQESTEFARSDAIAGLGRNQQIIDAALAAEVGNLAGPFETDAGAVLVEVVERQKFEAAAFEEAREATRLSEESRRLNEVLSSVVELRRRDLKPYYDPSVFENFGLDAPGAS